MHICNEDKYDNIFSFKRKLFQTIQCGKPYLKLKEKSFEAIADIKIRQSWILFQITEKVSFCLKWNVDVLLEALYLVKFETLSNHFEKRVENRNSRMIFNLSQFLELCSGKTDILHAKPFVNFKHKYLRLS